MPTRLWLAAQSCGYGLNCFGRSAAEMTNLVVQSGFADVEVCSLNKILSVPGEDIAEQHLLTARRNDHGDTGRSVRTARRGGRKLVHYGYRYFL